MNGMITRPALPMKFDVKAEPALFLSVYKHLTKSRIIIYWIFAGLSILCLVANFLPRIVFHDTTDWHIPVEACYLLLLSVLFLVMTYKRIRTSALAQARLTGEFIHYEITEEGVFSSAQDGYNYDPFTFMYKVVIYPDMWHLYFGEKGATTIKFISKSAFPDPAGQASFEALLSEKLDGKPMVYKT